MKDSNTRVVRIPPKEPSEYTCANCGEPSGFMGHYRSDETWGCRRPELPVALSDEDPTVDGWMVMLNRYQRDNLLWLLRLVGYPPTEDRLEPFTMAHTGDWVGEIAQMLDCNDGQELRPNATAAEIRFAVRTWVRQQRRGAD